MRVLSRSAADRLRRREHASVLHANAGTRCRRIWRPEWRRTVWSALLAALPCSAALADRQVHVPDGFSVELVAGPPLTERPIVGAFDEEGRLYVAESSGSNDPVQQQLAEKPHRVARLEDVDGDGRYDRRTVFADQMMFPEGAMYLGGSLYVSAPPVIWKLTDRDGDGVADERIEWFNGGTLTGCANDLHGPYAGPDGWIYWCKGAFAEQKHEVNGREFRSRASHIFRCRPDGSGLEPVLTGGMDNPVDVCFTPAGERILSATLVHSNPRYDGLLHAVYGGVYGKNHGVLEGHIRTGELMPVFELMDPYSPCGLERYDADAFGPEYRDNLFAAQFNMRRVSRHILQPSGSTFQSAASDFVWSDDVDFHPTDVLADADGSLLVFDTGGWYKLCCPTSQLWKPDVLGGIYRVRRADAKPPADPRGSKIAWGKQTLDELWALLADPRSAVRQRATREFASRKSTSKMAHFLEALPTRAVEGEPNNDSLAALARTWALVQLELPAAKLQVRRLAYHPDPSVRQAALHGISVYRDRLAAKTAAKRLADEEPAVRRVAAEALGRIGDSASVPALLAACTDADDRVLQHSIVYALIELADPAATKAGLDSDRPATVAAALLALDQMPGGELAASQVIPRLNSLHPGVQQAARWIVAQHPDWGAALADWFQAELDALPATAAAASGGEPAPLESLLAGFTGERAIQRLLAATAASAQAKPAARQVALRVMEQSSLRMPRPWAAALTTIIADEPQSDLLPQALAVARRLPAAKTPDPALQAALQSVANDAQRPDELRLTALAAIVAYLPELSASQFELLQSELSADDPAAVQTAAEAISQAPLSDEQLAQLCGSFQTAGPLELNKLVAPFARSTNDRVGEQLIAALREAPAVSSLQVDRLRETLARYEAPVQQRVADLESLVNADAADQRARIEALLPKLAGGDARRGDAVFHSSRAACTTCHRLGNAGGKVGPDLSHIGSLRTDRDLLESILYPNLSFVRSYEPMLLVTADGRAVSGIIRSETEHEYVIVTGPDQETRIPREDVLELTPSNISLMPTGLDKQLSEQDLADLIAFLKNAK